MALDTVITPAITYPGATGVRGPTTLALVTGTYAADDTDNHAMTFNTLDKRFMTYVVDNPSDKDVVVTIYGSPDEAKGVGDVGVFLIGTSITATAGSYKQDTTDEGAAFYIIRCTSAVASATGTTVTVYAHLMPT